MLWMNKFVNIFIYKYIIRRRLNWVFDEIFFVMFVIMMVYWDESSFDVKIIWYLIYMYLYFCVKLILLNIV